MIEVVPSIIPETFNDLEDQVSRVLKLVPLVQVDVEDGSYAPARSWPYTRTPDTDFTRIITEDTGLPHWEDINYELDFLVKDPEKKIDDWIKAGISSVIFHIESTNALSECIEKARYADISVGIALKPSTPNEAVYEWMEEIDFVQFMGNDKVGFHGVELDRKVLKKIRELRKENAELIIGIDIGVDTDTAPELVDAGATKLVSGSAIFESTDIEGTINFLESL